jgi:hypothetical protein
MIPFRGDILWKPARGGLAVFAFILTFLCLEYAQSGRRVPKTTAPPGHAASAAEKTESKPSDNTSKLSANKKADDKVKLLVARQTSSKSLSSEAAISSSFLKRLNGFTSIAAISIGDLTREQAIKRAQEEPDSFVLLLQFEIDRYQNGTIVWNSQDLEVKCLLFAPGTGKQKWKDRVYYQTIGGPRARRDNWPKGAPIKITPEAAAIALADRLHDWLALNGFQVS